ncbi:hypothetical protein [Endozoicomonas atrinae]|uniref:hypothetical protein n=1 Tax=Endozoicomonas atrinae TaxID=1333660 RepID=UPI003B00B5F3
MNDQQKKQYIQGGGVSCPYCGDGNLESLMGDYNESGVYYHVTCEGCHKKWTEVYTLTDVEVDDK